MTRLGTMGANQSIQPRLERCSTTATTAAANPIAPSPLLPSTTPTPSPTLFSFMPLSAPPTTQYPSYKTPMAAAATVPLQPASFADVFYVNPFGPMGENPSSMTASQAMATGSQAKKGSADGYDHVFYPFTESKSSNKQVGLGMETAATKSQDVFYPFGMGAGATRSDAEELVYMFYQLLGLGDGVPRMEAKEGRGWEAKEDEEGLHLCVEMPGLGKEHVTVSVEQKHILVIHGGIKPEPADQTCSTTATAIGTGSGRIFNFKFHVSENAFKMEGVKGFMKNGLLEITVPKMKKEDRKDTVQVQLDD